MADPLDSPYDYQSSVKVGGRLDQSSDYQLVEKNCFFLFFKGDGGKIFTECKKTNKNDMFLLIIEEVSTEGLSEGEVSAYLWLIKRESKTDGLVCPHCLHCTRGKVCTSVL